MENKQQYDLSEAVKQSYRVSPLRADLSATVTKKVFAGKPAAPAFTDNMLQLLLYFIAGLSAVFIIYYLVSAASFAVLIISGLFIAAYLWISWREINYYKADAL